MNITSTRLISSRQSFSSVKQDKQVSQSPTDSFTFGSMRRSTKKKLITGASFATGACLGGIAVAKYTGDFVGTAAKVAGGVGGAVAGGVVLGVAGLAIAAKFSDTTGFGGIAAAGAGMAAGGAIGATAGAYAGSLLGTGAGNVLGYVTGAVVGGVVGVLAAKGFNS